MLLFFVRGVNRPRSRFAAIWLKPASNAYGPWPASGEMDLVESRGNANLKHARSGETQGVQKVGATLHFGPNSSYNIWRLTHWEK